MSQTSPIPEALDHSPLGHYLINPDWLPDEVCHPEKREAVIAARQCGADALQLIHHLTDPAREDQFTALFKEAKSRPDAVPLLRAALMVETAWLRRFFAMNAFRENLRRVERETTIEAMKEIVPDPTIDEEPGPDEELDPEPDPEARGKWYVITEGEFHILYYAGKPTESKLRGYHGQETLERMARQFNQSGATPGRKRRPRTAIDAPCPQAFNARHADSPPLPLDENHQTKPETTMSAKAKAAPSIPSESTENAPVVDLIPASQFVRYPTNRVPNPDAVERMTESIREQGVIQPILARPIEDGSGGMNLQIIFGETRWRGCQGIDANYPVPVMIRHLNDRDAAKVHAIENFQRMDLTEIEEAREIQHMLDVGWNFDEIKSHVGRAKDWLYRRLNLLKLPEQGQQAVIDGNLSILTAAKIVSLPEEMREQAVKAVVEPTHAARALPERDAIQVLDRNFVKPWEEEQAWNEKRKLLERENPGCTWLAYKEAIVARHYQSEYEPADDRPSWSYLCEAAQNDEMPIPKWKELAEQHKLEIYIGQNHAGETTLYVKADAVIEAVRRAHANDRGNCLFGFDDEKDREPTEEEKAAKAAEEKARKEKSEQRRIALQDEKIRFARMILLDEGITKTATKKLAEIAYKELIGQDVGFESLIQILQIEAPENDQELLEQRRDVAFLKLLRAKDAIPFELIGRLYLADLVGVGWGRNSQDQAEWAFDTAAVKAEAFPHLHEIYQDVLEDRKEEEGREDAAA